MDCCNGFLITNMPKSYNGISYCGIETDTFPLGEAELSTNMTNEQQKSLEEILLFPENGISLLDLELARAYYLCCKNNNENTRVLYAEVVSEDNNLNEAWRDLYGKPQCFLGFDIGDCAYDFYSCVLNDIIINPQKVNPEFKDKLNKNGLFDNIQDARDFLKMRERIVLESSGVEFEATEGKIIALYEVSDGLK